MLNSSLKDLLRNASNLPPFTGRHTPQVPELGALSRTIFSLMEHDEPWEEWTKKPNALPFAVKKKDKNEQCEQHGRKIMDFVHKDIQINAADKLHGKTNM